jgi:hypothetical protein
MDGRNFTGGLWPIHLKPKKDELLTSWLTRLSVGHGTNLSVFFSSAFSRLTILKGDAWNRDLDKLAGPTLLQVLAERTATPPERVFATTLAAYEGILFEKHHPYGNSIWVMPVGVSHGAQRHPGLQFCPLCLAEDEEPYYRRSWRLAFITLCVEHKIPLLDRCAECGSPVAFHKRLTGNPCDVPSFNIVSCQSCAADLRSAASGFSQPTPEISEQEIFFQKSLMEAMNNGWTEVPGSGAVHSYLYFRVLRRLMALLSGGRRAAMIRERVSRRYGVENFTVTHRSNKNQYIEFLEVSTRRGLLNMTREMLRDWPNEFIIFCQTNKLWSQLLLKDLSSAPFWFWTVVQNHLTRTTYGITDEEVRSALHYMEELNRQHSLGYRPYRYAEKMKAVSDFLKRARHSKYYGLNKWSNMQLKSSWMTAGWTSKREHGPTEPATVRFIPDDLWVKVEKLLPPPPLYPNGRNRRTVDDRKIVNGMLYVLCTSTVWQKVPAEFGPYTTIYQRYVRLKDSGLLTPILALCSDIYSNPPGE